MKAIGYIRVSTEEQAKSGLGLSDQRTRIRSYCEMKGLELIRMLEDPGCSGAKPLAERQAGSILCSELNKRRKIAVVILKLDRGFRNAADCLRTVEGWIKRGVSLHVIDLGGNAVDTSTAAGKFMLTVLAGAAEMERNLTCERTKAAMAKKAEMGELRSTHPPFGYDIAQGPRIRESDGKHIPILVPNQKEQAAILRIEDLRRRGLSYKAISEVLVAEGVLSRASTPLSVKTIRLVLLRRRAERERESAGRAGQRQCG